MTKPQIVGFPARLARCSRILGMAVALAACGDSNQYAAPPPPKVTVATPVERPISHYFDATGNTVAVNSVDLVARVQGFVQAISYTDGAFVKKDTSLFTIEPEPYNSIGELVGASTPPTVLATILTAALDAVDLDRSVSSACYPLAAAIPAR